MDGNQRTTDNVWKWKDTEKFTEKTVFSLTEREVDRCRYEIINMTQRMAECYIHRDNFSHGIKLHPPHLYDLRDGVVYFRQGKGWEKWRPNLKSRKESLSLDTE